MRRPGRRSRHARTTGGQSSVTYYDQLGNKTREVNANGEAQSWRYDEFGRATSYADLAGVATTSTYNKLGLIAASTSARSNSTYGYGVNGLLKSIAYNALAYDNATWWNQTTSYDYDIAGKTAMLLCTQPYKLTGVSAGLVPTQTSPAA